MPLYLRITRWTLHHRWITMFSAIGFFVGSLFLVPLIPSGFIPPKAVVPEPQERNTVGSQPAGFTAASGMDKKILAATDNKHTMSTWIEYLKGKYSSGYRESDEYLKMIKTIS
jgi:multidrug efflux pump subunit AcrB